MSRQSRSMQQRRGLAAAFNMGVVEKFVINDLRNTLKIAT
jgi:hypothetical protein